MGWKVVVSKPLLDRVELVAPVLEDASVTETPVVEGGVAKVETSSNAIVIVAPAPELVDVEIA